MEMLINIGIIIGILIIVSISIKLLMLLFAGLLYLWIGIKEFWEDRKFTKNIIKHQKKKMCDFCMKKCKDCKYWEPDNRAEVRYNSNFGYCNCDKFVYREDLHDEHCEIGGEKYDNYDIIYSDSEGLAADLRVHKEFGCINFKNKQDT